MREIRVYRAFLVNKVTLFIFLILSVLKVNSQEITVPLIYGGSINQSISSVSDGVLTIGLNIVQARRTYGLAVILDDEEKVNGAEFVHKIFVNRKKSTESYDIKNFSFRPYIVYNLVYKRALSETQKNNNLIIYKADYYNVTNIEEPEKVTTIQHNLGLGIEKDLFHHLFINISTFAGFQLGNNNNNNKIDSSVDQHQENTFTWNLKLGFGCRF